MYCFVCLDVNGGLGMLERTTHWRVFVHHLFYGVARNNYTGHIT